MLQWAIFHLVRGTRKRTFRAMIGKQGETINCFMAEKLNHILCWIARDLRKAKNNANKWEGGAK